MTGNRHVLGVKYGELKPFIPAWLISSATFAVVMVSMFARTWDLVVSTAIATGFTFVILLISLVITQILRGVPFEDE